MIEVEMQFQPNRTQLEKLLEGAQFIGEIENHDTYYDYPDYRLSKKGIRLRKRNDSFELKIEKVVGIADEEIENTEEIKKFFKIGLSIEEFIEKNLHVLIDFKNKRLKYKKEEFNIDVDECDFGYSATEIEIMVESENKIEESREKIRNFALNNGLEIKKIMSKRKAYLSKNSPEIFKEIWG